MNAFGLTRSSAFLPIGGGLDILPPSIDLSPITEPINNWFFGGGSLGESGLIQDLDNLLSGNLDYQRQKELQEAANAFSWKAQKDAQEFNSNQAKVQREWEEMMSNSAYSRAFADVRKQGLNPYILANPASTPSGAVASSPTAFGARGSVGRSGQAFAMLLGALINGAFSLARASIQKPGAPTGYTDTWIDSQGEIRGYRQRSY